MKQTTEAAYAKINLCLDVTARRPDGYHEIDGVMQSVTLCDALTVTFAPSSRTEVALYAEGNPQMPTDRRNLAVRAAERFLAAANMGGEVHIGLQKRIPMAAGLAGGSTDAAAVLRALNRLTGFPLTAGELGAFGLGLGADVPFCIAGGSRRTQGIGELLEPCPPLPPCHLVIARRGEGVSTPWAYARLDELYHSFAADAVRPSSGLPGLLEALGRQSLDGVCGRLYNVFEPVVEECLPDVALLRGGLLSGGALAARMSGSGPAVYGVFRTEAEASDCCRALRELGAETYICCPQATEIPIHSYAVHN